MAIITPFVILVVLGALYFFPVPVALSISLFSSIFLNRNNYVLVVFLFSFWFIFFGMAMDPISYIGDYSRYYLSFYRPMEQILATGKLYRYFVFESLQFLDFGPQFYTGLSLFFNYFLTTLISLKFVILFIGNHRKSLLTFFMLAAIMYPSTAIGNFESMLSFNLIYLSFYLFVIERKWLSYLAALFAPLIHPAAIPLTLLMFFPILCYSRFTRIRHLVMGCAGAGIFLFLTLPLDSVMPFVGHIQRKAITFLTGPWSEYIERRDFEFIIIAMLKFAVCYFSIFVARNAIYSKEIYSHVDRVLSVSKYMLPYFVLCILSRTLAERYIYFGMFFFFPLLVLAMMNCKRKVNRVFLISLCLTIVFLPQNIIVFGVIATKGYTMETIDMNLVELLVHTYGRAPDPVGRL
ncbi:hypothetical protein [Vibrio genomosp. F6]|uniref:hypothetical protein n=1 Tax=Vibrio genomosp. F6 TaxID=723172 RepID=UPI0002E13654|nr:hypothetical protein [Vibrio genomosp. F6]